MLSGCDDDCKEKLQDEPWPVDLNILFQTAQRRSARASFSYWG
jgi:hypothetical protein